MESIGVANKLIFIAEDLLPGGVFALWRGAQHGYVGHDDDIVFGAHRLLFAENIDAFRIEAQRAIGILNNILLRPGLTEMEIWDIVLWLVLQSS